jgi:hypothetical protein
MGPPERRRANAWVKDEPFGVEFAEIAIGEAHLGANGVAIGTEPVPYRLDYELETSKGFVTVRLRATSRGDVISTSAAAPTARGRWPPIRRVMLTSRPPAVTPQVSPPRWTAISDYHPSRT